MNLAFPEGPCGALCVPGPDSGRGGWRERERREGGRGEAGPQSLGAEGGAARKPLGGGGRKATWRPGGGGGLSLCPLVLQPRTGCGQETPLSHPLTAAVAWAAQGVPEHTLRAEARVRPRPCHRQSRAPDRPGHLSLSTAVPSRGAGSSRSLSICCEACWERVRKVYSQCSINAPSCSHAAGARGLWSRHLVA